MNNNTMSDFNVSQEPSIYYEKYSPDAILVDKYVTFYIYAVGFPGNIISLVIWLQRRMRHSSGYYLAALSLGDLIFLSLQVVYELNEKWNVKLLDIAVICEMYPMFFLTSQYLSPMFVLGFTVERYISICHPFARERMCTTKRAKIVIVCMTVFASCLGAMQLYFWQFNSEKNECGLRQSVTVNNTTSIWSIWTWCIEALIFFLVPLSILLFNILVIIEVKRISKYERRDAKSGHQKNAATTVMLLVVSFYQIFTVLPVTIVVTLYYSYVPGDPEVLKTGELDSVWKRHFDYMFVKTVIEEIGLTHYACNFFIYIITGKVFRQEFKRLFRKIMCSKFKSDSNSITTFGESKRGNRTQMVTMDNSCLDNSNSTHPETKL